MSKSLRLTSIHRDEWSFAGHIISASGGHGDVRAYAARWNLAVSAIADGTHEIRRLVRREHIYGADWIKTANAGGYFSVGDDPAGTTWFDELRAGILPARPSGSSAATTGASSTRSGL